MSDLEEENRPNASAGTECIHGQGEDQIGGVSVSRTGFFCSARQIYCAVPIPEELNTRVRAVIESDRKLKRQHCFCFTAAAIAVAVVCYFLTPADGFLFRRETRQEEAVSAEECTREPIRVRIRKLRKK